MAVPDVLWRCSIEGTWQYPGDTPPDPPRSRWVVTYYLWMIGFFGDAFTAQDCLQWMAQIWNLDADKGWFPWDMWRTKLTATKLINGYYAESTFAVRMGNDVNAQPLPLQSAIYCWCDTKDVGHHRCGHWCPGWTTTVLDSLGRVDVPNNGALRAWAQEHFNQAVMATSFVIPVVYDASTEIMRLPFRTYMSREWRTQRRRTLKPTDSKLPTP